MKEHEPVKQRYRRHSCQTRSAAFMCEMPFIRAADFVPSIAINDYNRECLAVEIDTSITGKRLIRALERLRSERGLPEILRVDSSLEFLNGDFVAWVEQTGMALH